MSFIKNLVLVLMFIFSMNYAQLNAANVNEPATVAQDSQVTEEAAIELLKLFGSIEKSQPAPSDLGIACWEAKAICGTVDCCHWVEKYKTTSCNDACNDIQNTCANCPSEYKILCDAGCKYKDQCGDLCPCIKNHCD